MVTVLNTRVSEEEEIKILQARREAVKMATRVRSNLPTELQWMYEDLKMQGVVDVAEMPSWN
jgi:hypothetical protein